MSQSRKSWFVLLLLILAGESVFILPFVLARVFRPTVLEVFDLTNLELGLCFSVYGFVAVVSYLFGGPLADRYPPRKLIAVALWMTALGGLIYTRFPSYETLRVLYGYWGFTTIFLFWAPMIKATRVWGGNSSQGLAFGILDGGRGLVGALFGALGVFVFSLFIDSGVQGANLEQRKVAFEYVIQVSAVLVALVGILVWFFMRFDPETERKAISDRINLVQVREVLAIPSVRLLMLIILCAYVGYKITDIFSLYARDVMEYDQVQAAQVGTLMLVIRPVIGIGIGLLADRSQISLWLLISFLVSMFGASIFASGIISSTTTILFFISIFIVASGVYASRALYFAVMQKGRIPLVYTGTAVGLASLIGYTPDIFAGPLMGYLLDASPGEPGHQHVFVVLALFALIGGAASWRFHHLYGKSR